MCEHEAVSEGKRTRLGNRTWWCEDCGAKKIIADADLDRWAFRYAQSREGVVRALLI